MKKIVFGSLRPNAGKTSVIIGAATALNRKIGYLKPFGDRLVYQNKQLWDHDAGVVSGVLGLKGLPGALSVGFEHAKLRYKYDKAKRKAKLAELVNTAGKGKDFVFIEGGKNITHGISVHLDAISVARYINGKLIIIIQGDEDMILDDIIFLKKYVDMRELELGGVIINKVQDLEEFKNTFKKNLSNLGIPVLGILPYHDELNYIRVEYLKDYLSARVLAGGKGLGMVVKNIYV